MVTNIDTNGFESRMRLKELRVAHRDLDSQIATMIANANVDQLRIKRLKKRKLLLKDMIVRLESELIPNLNA